MTQIAIPKFDVNSPAYQKMHKQAVDFEGVFLNTLMKEMFSTIDTSDKSMGGGFAEETWRGMQAEQLAGAMAEKGGIGLADAMMPDLLRLQEAQSGMGV
jgi:peptidoglycan hydrolase FlgJ